MYLVGKLRASWGALPDEYANFTHSPQPHSVIHSRAQPQAFGIKLG